MLFGGGAFATWPAAVVANSTFPIWPIFVLAGIAAFSLYMCFATIGGWRPTARSLDGPNTGTAEVSAADHEPGKIEVASNQDALTSPVSFTPGPPETEPEPTPAVTDRWFHTSDCGKVPALMPAPPGAHPQAAFNDPGGSAQLTATGDDKTAGKPDNSPDSWRQLIDKSRALTVSSYSGASHHAAFWTVVVLASWASNAIWLASAEKPHRWLALVAVISFGSMLFIHEPRQKSRLLRKILLSNELRSLDELYRRLIWYCFVICVISYLACTWNSSQLVQCWGVGAAFLYTLAAIAMNLSRKEAEENKRAKAARERQPDVIAAMKRRRWLTDADSDHVMSALLDPLTIIPAVRFAKISGGYFSFLAIAGTQVVLAAFVDWPSGEYTRLSGLTHEIHRDGQLSPPAATDLGLISAGAGKWRVLLDGIHGMAIQVVVVIRPDASSREGTITLRFSEDDDISVVTQDTFANAVGHFLARGAHELNPRVLERVHSHLSEALPSDAPAVGTPTSGERAALPAGAVPPSTKVVALPEPAQFDSVAADAMRQAASPLNAALLRRLGKGLDTCTVLLAVTKVHASGRWDRIWQHSAQTPEEMASQERVIPDPTDHPRESWNGLLLTATCASALRAAARASDQRNAPIGQGTLVLGLVSDPASAAARALGVGISITHEELLRLIEDDLLDVGELRDTS